MEHMERNEVEQAITAFMVGLDRGECKCAYGIIHTLTHDCSYTMSEEEGISIFRAAYPDIKRLAEKGDAEAMRMVAEGIRLGFVEDEDEPYLYWLTKAASLGNSCAEDLLRELDEGDDPFALPDLSECLLEGGADETDLLLLAQDAQDIDLPEEHVLLAEPDFVLREQFGINDYLKRKEMRYELMKCLDSTVLGEKADHTEFSEQEDEE
jgi:hypothetical protein